MRAKSAPALRQPVAATAEQCSVFVCCYLITQLQSARVVRPGHVNILLPLALALREEREKKRTRFPFASTTQRDGISNSSIDERDTIERVAAASAAAAAGRRRERKKRNAARVISGQAATSNSLDGARNMSKSA